MPPPPTVLIWDEMRPHGAKCDSEVTVCVWVWVWVWVHASVYMCVYVCVFLCVCVCVCVYLGKRGRGREKECERVSGVCVSV